MNSKLTLRVNKSLIGKAKKYAKRKGKSVSQMVSEYFTAIQDDTDPVKSNSNLGPVTLKLKGCLKGKKSKIEEYRKHLERKYL